MQSPPGSSNLDAPPVALIAVMGLPGSGKTTLCRKLSSRGGAPPGVACVHLEFDQFVPDPVVDTDSTDAWKRDRGRLLKSLEGLLANRLRPRPSGGSETVGTDCEPLDQRLAALFDNLLLLSATSSSAAATPPPNNRRQGFVLLLDDNFYYASMRHAVFQLARLYNCGYGAVHLKASPGRLKLVNAMRENPVPEGVIERMSLRLEAPNPLRNAWEKYTLVLRDGDMGFLDDVGHYTDNSVNGELHSLLGDCLGNPFEPINLEEAARQADAAREVCSLSLLHQADLRLRAIVADWLAARVDRPEEVRAELGAAAASNKRALMNALRDGKLKVPAQLNAYSPVMLGDLDKFLHENICLPS